MIHIATVHHRSPRWIDIQLRQLARHFHEPFKVWASLQGIDPAYGSRFDVVVPSRGKHDGKLNLLARRIVDVAPPDDILIFMDGDAFPIADPMPTVRAALKDTALLAVRRDETRGWTQPHPCFCATTVGAWRDLRGDWSTGHVWTNDFGTEVTDVGGNLLYILQSQGIPWTPLLRSNRIEIHPPSSWFGIYGGIIYHHGAGFRRHPVDNSATMRFAGASNRALRALAWRTHPFLGVIRRRAIERLSERIFRELQDDPQSIARLASPLASGAKRGAS